MAFDLVRSAKHIRDLSNAEFRVLFYLLDSANQETLECFPRISTIAHHTEMDERTVQRHIASLVKRGLFTKLERRRADGGQASNCFRFNIEGTVQVGNEAIVVIKAPAPDEPELPLPPGGTVRGGGGETVTPSRPGCHPNNQVLEPGIEEPEDSPLPPLGEEGLKNAKIEIGRYYESKWNELADKFPRIASFEMTDRRLPKLMARLADKGIKLDAKMSNEQALDAVLRAQRLIDAMLEKIANSPFLCGEVKKWAIYGEWVLGPENWQKTWERKNERADDTGPGGRSSVAAGRRVLERLDAGRRAAGNRG